VANKQGKTVYLNFITQVSPACDCYGHCDAPIVNDIGICASIDPVALDQACADLVNNAKGNEDSPCRQAMNRVVTSSAVSGRNPLAGAA
jgi:uncharacterized protein